ncbi:hypothetical protein ACFYY2_12025 [Streptomyces sp. NPDC001822]|uniref:hypothetical protein n=1 Tax=Streptomyces sp. NPDC001822 TaxID=3364614 RepID=UPI0036C641BE
MVYPLEQAFSEPATPQIQGQQTVRQLRDVLSAHGLEFRTMRLSGFDQRVPAIFLGEISIEAGRKLTDLLGETR